MTQYWPRTSNGTGPHTSHNRNGNRNELKRKKIQKIIWNRFRKEITLPSKKVKTTHEVEEAAQDLQIRIKGAMARTATYKKIKNIECFPLIQGKKENATSKNEDRIKQSNKPSKRNTKRIQNTKLERRSKRAHNRRPNSKTKFPAMKDQHTTLTINDKKSEKSAIQHQQLWKSGNTQISNTTNTCHGKRKPKTRRRKIRGRRIKREGVEEEPNRNRRNKKSSSYHSRRIKHSEKVI